MFLHIGSEEIVYIKDIIAIMDIEKTTVSPITREFLKVCEEEGFIKAIDEEEIPKSFIIAYKGGIQIVYLSPLSAATLYRRYQKLASDKKNGVKYQI